MLTISPAMQTPFSSVQHVSFDDLDALNILHNMRFVLFMERARGELFNALGFHWQDDIGKNPDKFHVVASHDVRYLAPVKGEGDLIVLVEIPHLGTSSLILETVVQSMDGRTVYAKGTTRLVRLDPETFRPASWSEKFRAALGPIVRKPAP